jgi:creatinine amidohydrolase
MVNSMNHARFHRLEEITLKTLRALDRDKTVVLIPVGMLEEHGEHLPLGTDSYAAEGLALAAVAWLLENDQSLHVLLMPLIPYGTDAVDRQRPELFERSGSVWISRETLKAIVKDIAGHMVRYGFHFIFPIGFHGGPDQSVALDEACSEMRSQHQGLVMYEPVGYILGGAEKDMSPGLATLLGRPLTAKEEVALKGSIHASMFETSMMLMLRPELVDPSYKRLRTIEWQEMYDMPDWPGYVGSGPAHADSAVGGAVLRWRGVRCASLIHRAMQGEDLSGLQRHPKWQQAGEGAEDIAAAPTTAPSVKPEPPEAPRPDKSTSADQLQNRPPAPADQPHISDDPNATPPSTLMETKPGLSRRPGHSETKPG